MWKLLFQSLANCYFCFFFFCWIAQIERINDTHLYGFESGTLFEEAALLENYLYDLNEVLFLEVFLGILIDSYNALLILDKGEKGNLRRFIISFHFKTTLVCYFITFLSFYSEGTFCNCHFYCYFCFNLYWHGSWAVNLKQWSNAHTKTQLRKRANVSVNLCGSFGCLCVCVCVLTSQQLFARVWSGTACPWSISGDRNSDTNGARTALPACVLHKIYFDKEREERTLNKKNCAALRE